ncbi:MAG: inositol monophosphatase [Chloroflexi bacterium]|nr:inositol monophosphatase [Chloroflexota bacterium]
MERGTQASTNELALELATACTAARGAGYLLKERYGSIRESDVEFKGKTNVVTAVDRAAEQIVVESLLAGFPHSAILAEEAGRREAPDADRTWIIDPLDGTSNYVRGLPHFAVSIACEIRGQVELGVVYAPVLDELFWAQRGRGAWLNGRRLSVSKTRHLVEALVSSGFPYEPDKLGCDNLPEWARVVRAIRSARSNGAAALDLCYVACGRLDGHWELELEAWDVAAGALLVREAGGGVTGADGSPFTVRCGQILATNGHLHGELLALLQAARA